MSRIVTRFCASCGQPIVRRVPAGDSRERDVCAHCGAVHYVNPRPVVGTMSAAAARPGRTFRTDWPVWRSRQPITA